MTYLDKAREWAEEYKGFDHLTNRFKAAIDIIQSLPDQWVDIEKVREIMEPFMNSYEGNPRDAVQAIIALLTPKLPTLADMTQEEREACRWMQCMIADDTDEYCLLITVDDPCSRVLFQNGDSTIWNNDLITPLPDLPKLQWPGGVVDCEIVDEPETANPDPIHTPMQPSEVPPNEPWLIEVDGRGAVGTRCEGDAVRPWAVAALDGLFAEDYMDSDVALIHKLVPEPPALPEGMRLADNEKYGRVVVSPRTDDNGDYMVFLCTSEEVTGADWEYAPGSELTFLDGVDG